MKEKDLEFLKEMSGWIPVRERLPEYEQSVLIRIRNQADKKYDSWSIGYYKGEDWYYDFDQAKDYKVNQDDGYIVSDWFDPFTLHSILP